MTLNEAIEYYDGLAEECRRKASIERNDYMDLRDESAEYSQLSEWLAELAVLREKVNCSELPNSSDLVSRSYLLAEYDRQHQGPPGGARKIIEEAPSIAPQRKPGHWIDVGTGMTMWPVKCSVCGIRQSADSKYCPDCGARMLKEGES